MHIYIYIYIYIYICIYTHTHMYRLWKLSDVNNDGLLLIRILMVNTAKDDTNTNDDMNTVYKDVRVYIYIYVYTYIYIYIYTYTYIHT